MVAVWHGDVAYEGGDLEIVGSRHRLVMVKERWTYERHAL
jgi:hypothetical protein